MSEYFIGLMSGTSADGIDAALIGFEDGKISLIESYYKAYSQSFRGKLQAACSTDPISLESIGTLDAELGNRFAECTLKLLEKAGFQGENIQAIGSHGHTIFHSPQSRIPFSWQIGDPNRIAEITGITTIADFRRRDIAAGGQGAPLAPAFHKAVFQCQEENRVILNIGGIANITVLPKQPDIPVMGFDTGPGNALLDYWAKKHLNAAFDKDGEWAKLGNLNAGFCNTLKKDAYFLLTPPKSTGKEYFSPRWLDNKLQQLPQKLSTEDIQASLCQLTVSTIIDAIHHHAANLDRLLICGGGAKNTFLVNLLRQQLDCAVNSTDYAGIDPDWVEAMAFAWLAKQTLDGQSGNLLDVTGAGSAVILGGIYPALRQAP